MTQASSCTGDGNPLANAAFRLLEGFVDRHTLSLFNWDPVRLIGMFETYRAKNRSPRGTIQSFRNWSDIIDERYLEGDQLQAQ